MLMASSDEQRMRTALDELDATSHARPLTKAEVIRLENALNRRHGRKRNDQWRWSKADVLRLRRHLLTGHKPAAIATLMRRSERSIWRMMNRLGWTVRDAAALSGTRWELWVINPEEPIAWGPGCRRQLCNGASGEDDGDGDNG